MAPPIAVPVVDSTGKTRLRASLERAKRGDGASIGQWLEFPGYSLARTIAPLGEDVSLLISRASVLWLHVKGLRYLTRFRWQWVLIDTEHGNIDDRDMYLQVGAISTSGVSPIVRIPASEHWMFKRALDCGAHAIMVPMCETKVRVQNFPPADMKLYINDSNLRTTGTSRSDRTSMQIPQFYMAQRD